MARKKNLSLDEKIINTKELIADYEEKLKNTKNELKELEAEKEVLELQKLRDSIKASGKTIEEAIEIIKS